tara:strand:- start:47 stop:223 length:177 start_codon:yes stop_codon:yes gene_type:complete
MDIEVRRITVNCGNVEVKDLKELNSLYSEGAIDEVVSDYISKIKYKYYLNGKKIKEQD